MCADAEQWSRMRALVTQVTFQHVIADIFWSHCMCKPVVRSAGAGGTGGLFVLESRSGRAPCGAACLAAWSGTSLFQAVVWPLASLHTVLPCLPAVLQVSKTTGCNCQQLSYQAWGQTESAGIFGWALLHVFVDILRCGAHRQPGLRQQRAGCCNTVPREMLSCCCCTLQTALKHAGTSRVDSIDIM